MLVVLQIKLEAEVTFFEGAPDPSEMIAPAVSILTVIGIVPFAASLARQAWVKYTLTSRRIKVGTVEIRSSWEDIMLRTSFDAFTGEGADQKSLIKRNDKKYRFFPTCLGHAKSSTCKRLMVKETIFS